MERRALSDAGVDDQAVDWAVYLARLIESVAETFPVRHIALDRRTTKSLGDREKRVDASPEQRQFRARGVEVLGSGGADAGTAAGDQRMTALKLSPHRFVLAERQ